MPSNRSHYHLLEKYDTKALYEDASSVDSHETLIALQPRRTWSRLCCLALPWLIHFILLSISATMLLYSTNVLSQPNYCIKKLSEYSPGLDALTDKTETVRFSGSFGAPSLYKGPPTPEVDRRWNDIAELGAMQITEEEFNNLNASKHSVRVPEVLGGGYLALPEYLHHIHCVRILWESTWPDYFTERHQRHMEEPEEWHEHMDHCADMLRQKLMCDADMSLITYSWVKGHYMPHPNFNVQHQCRNYEVARQWGLSRRVNASSLGRHYFTRPADGDFVEFDEPPFDPLADS